MSKSQKLRIALIILVCALVFAVSFDHIVWVAQTYGHADKWTARAYAACADLVVLISALTLVAPRGVNASARRWARIGRWYGNGATVLCNLVASGFADAPALTLPLVVSMVVCLMPAAALIITVELAIHGAQGTPASRKRG